MPRCRALGVQGYPTFIRGIHAEERGSQGVWKGSSTRAPYDGVLPAPVDRGRPAWVTWSDGGRFIVPDTRNLKQMQQQQQKLSPKNRHWIKRHHRGAVFHFPGTFYKEQRGVSFRTITENDKQVTGQM